MAFGALGVLGWATTHQEFASGLPSLIPMPPITAILFLITGITLLFMQWSSTVLLTTVLSRVLGFSSLALTILVAIEFFTPVHLGLESLFVRNPSSLGPVPIARISPIAATFFILCSFSLIALQYRSYRIRAIGAGLALTVAGFDGIVILGYLYGTPLLYGGTIIPMALTTALAFGTLSFGLMWMAGSDTFPRRPFAGSSTRATLLRAFLPLPVVFVTLTGLFHQIFPFHWNPALVAAISGWMASTLILLLISKVAGSVGGSIDRAEAAVAQANTDLVQTYDTTLEGWARALDLRDKVTEGHCRRVSDMTARLAQFMGVPQEEIIHFRRGALLHDIGKMGLPDRILMKPGPLTPEEWDVMRKHPEYAMQMLGSIAYLRPALDIPYAHHERWDGTGYPRRLKGEDIPLSARIFAVVDIWDALMFERPYHAPWPAVHVREYIQSLSGTHLEPRIVEAFFKMIDSESPAPPMESGHGMDPHPVFPPAPEDKPMR